MMNVTRVTRIISAVFLIICSGTLAISQTNDTSRKLATMSADRSEVRWQSNIDYSQMVLSVSGPDGEVFRKEFKAGRTVSFSLIDRKGLRVPDGYYTYEITFVPRLSDAVKDALRASREDGNTEDVKQELKRTGQLPEGMVESGSFLVDQGGVVVAGASEPPQEHGRRTSSGTGSLAPQDAVTPDDVIVQGSLCVGFDCVNNESFGFDTIRMKENNTRIKFDDTSTSAGFAATDWQLTANDSPSGGLNKFSIEDITMSTVPFTILGGAPTNSVFVGSNGKVGFRNSTPGLDLHMTTSDTPAIRFEQTSSGGFTAQTWDIGANEANFFVRDLTGGSRLPLRIRPGAPTSSLDINAEGNVGIGTASPAQKLHVRLDADTALRTYVENASNTANAVVIIDAKANTAQASLRAHADARTISRFGVSLGGWAELLQEAGNGFVIGTFQSKPLILGTNSTSVIHLTPTGNVGIGTSTPAGKLDVNGSIFQRGGVLHADYVFDPNYKIESIEDHATFMWKNRHLPGVPARTVDSEGREIVEIGARSRGILEELEKAHVYVSQLNERLTQKEESITKLTEIVNAQQALLSELNAKLEALEKKSARE